MLGKCTAEKNGRCPVPLVMERCDVGFKVFENRTSEAAVEMMERRGEERRGEQRRGGRDVGWDGGGGG